MSLRAPCYWQAVARLRRAAPLARACSTSRYRVFSLQADARQGKLRLDAFLTTQVQEATRGKLQACIKAGNVTVNGQTELKTSLAVRAGDLVQCTLLEAPTIQAIPEALPLDVVFEDEHLMVINKAAGMVVHPGYGNHSGTMVNAILHHCNLPAIPLDPSLNASMEDAAETDGLLDSETDDDPADADADADADAQISLPYQPGAHLRPGIVHRLDKGTTGLLVVAKDEQSLAKLSEQFKERSVQRTYKAITLGCPSAASGQVATNIGRDARDRKKMAAYALDSSRGKRAVSGYTVLQPLAGGTSALMEWRLQTGRTHQIRVHAKHLGHPLFGDEAYGGSGGTAVKAIGAGKSLRQAVAWKALKELARPALHAQTLGFTHPITGARMQFTSDLPADFQQTLSHLTQLV